MRKRYLFLGLLSLALVIGVIIHSRSQSPVAVQQATTQSPAKIKPQPFTKSQYSITDPASIWIVVNKRRPLQPQDYAPSDLVVPNLPTRLAGAQVRSVMLPDLYALFAAARDNGTPMRISSGYRSYSYQVGLYNGYVAKQGQAVADSQSARPGYSEHQTGLAVDVSPEAGNCSVEVCFATTPAGQWLIANAYKYGFLIRYGEGDTATTGYSYEPWHIRYIGKPLAAELHAKKMTTLETFFDLGAAPNY